jgi:hypothetical protein
MPAINRTGSVKREPTGTEPTGWQGQKAAVRRQMSDIARTKPYATRRANKVAFSHSLQPAQKIKQETDTQLTSEHEHGKVEENRHEDRGEGQSIKNCRGKESINETDSKQSKRAHARRI